MGIDAMKFVIAQMKHESHSFMPEQVSLKGFNLFGEDTPFENDRAIEALRGSNSGAAAFIDSAENIGADYEVPVAGEALPLGPAEDAAFEYMSGNIIAAVKKGCDAVLLDLHGSMTTPAYRDAEGELLHRIRTVAPEMPIAVSLDFHCTLTPEMIDNSTVISIYRTTPHIDMYATGQRAAETLLSHLKGASRAVMVARRIPLMANLERMGDKTPPMQDLIDMLQQVEAMFNKKTGIRELLSKIDQKETECDYAERRIVQKIFDSELEPFLKLQLKEIIKIMGEISDHAERVARRVNIINMKRRV